MLVKLKAILKDERGGIGLGAEIGIPKKNELYEASRVKFEEPYKKGDFKKINDQIDKITGWISTGEHYKKDFHIRESFIDSFLQDESIPVNVKKYYKIY